MATKFTPTKAKDLKRGDVLYGSNAVVLRPRDCLLHESGVFLRYSERGQMYDDCFPADYVFVTMERV